MRVGGGEHVVGVVVAGREGVEVVPPLPELAGFVRVGIQLGVFLGVTERLAKPRMVARYEVFWVLSCGWRGVGGAPAVSLPFLEGGGPAVGGGGGALRVGAGAWGRTGAGANTRCDRSRMDAWRSAIPWEGCWSWAGGRFASCEEMSWSSSLRFSFSSEMFASALVTPLNSWEMVTRPWTSWERRVIVVPSEGMVPDSVSGAKSGRSWLLRRRALLAWPSCPAMKWRGRYIEGVPDLDGRGELRAERLPKAVFPGGSWCGFAIVARRRGKVGEEFVPEAKRGKVLSCM